MKELLEFIVRSLVDYPDEVQVNEITNGHSIVLELSVAGSDMGRVIGKSGRVINAIRSILKVRAAKDGTNVSLELLESGEGY